jgi:hypothetical protein
MATTPTHAIVYPVVGNTITPLATHFANLANSTDAALTALGDKQDGAVGTDAQRLALTGAIKREGLQYYTNDTNRNWVYDGTTWLSNDSGIYALWPTSVVGATVSATGHILPNSGAKTVSVNGVFTSRFRAYQIMFGMSLTAADTLGFRLRVGGTDNSTANYSDSGVWNTTGTGTGSAAYNNGINFWPLAPGGSTQFNGVVTVFNPASTIANQVKSYQSTVSSQNTVGIITRGGQLNGHDATSFDGFTIYEVSGTGDFNNTATWFKVYGLT